MARMPGATWLGEHSPKRLMSRYDIVCVHTIVGYAPAHAAHFSVKKDGTILQSRDTKYQSAANLDGNPRVIAIENEDAAQDVPLSPEQVVSNARIMAWVHRTHGTPLQMAPNSRPTSRGLAYHRQGIDGNFGGYAYPGRVSGGEKWSTSFGKVCPRDKRIAQLPEILRRAKLIVNPPPPPAPKWVPEVGIRSDLSKIQEQFQIVQGLRTGAIVRYNGVGRIQQELNERGASLTVDGLCDAATVAAWKKWESSLPPEKRSGSAGTPDPKSLAPMGLIFSGPEAVLPKVRVRIGIHNVYVKRPVADVNATYSVLLAKVRPHAVLLQETAQMYGKWNIPGYKVIQFAPKRIHEGHVIETSSNTVLVRNDVAVEYKGLLDLDETWKGPKVGAMHDPRAPITTTITVGGKDVRLLDVHGPFTPDAVAEFNAAVADWIKTSPYPAMAGGDYNQSFDSVTEKIARLADATVNGKAPDMVVWEDMDLVDSENHGKQGSDTHYFKTFDMEL